MPVASEPAEGEWRFLAEGEWRFLAEGEWRSLAKGEWRSPSDAIGAVIGSLAPESIVSAGSAPR
jgi:hypothetical protein